MSPSPARITSPSPSRENRDFQASLRSSDSPNRSRTRPLTREKSPPKSPPRSSSSLSSKRPDSRLDSTFESSWRPRADSEIKSNSKNSKDKSASVSPPPPPPSTALSSSTIPDEPLRSSSMKSKSEYKYESKNWEKCGEREDTWPKMTANLTSSRAPSSSRVSSNHHRSPSRESEKHVRINLEPTTKSSFSREYHSESSSRAFSSSNSGDLFGDQSANCQDGHTTTQTTSSKKEIIELSIQIPEDGWSLKDAIKQKLLNPKSGMFTISGAVEATSITFREALKAKIINPISAEVVVDPSRSSSTSPSLRPVSLYRAVEKGILDDNGFYQTASRRKISLEEAIDRKYVTFDEKVKTSDNYKVQNIRIVRMENGGPTASSEVTFETDYPNISTEATTKSSSSYHHSTNRTSDHDDLSSWLHEVDAKLSEFDTDGHDLEDLESQRSKLSSLRSEFKQKVESRRAFDSTGETLRSRMNSLSDEYNQIIEKMEKLHSHWSSTESEFLEKERKVKQMDEFYSNFREKLSKLEDDVDKLTSDLEYLKICETDASEKFSRLKSLAEQLQKSTITEWEVITDHLYQLVRDTSEAEDIRSKFNGVELKARKLADEMKRLGQYLAKLETFESIWKELNEWTTRVSEKLSEELKISTDESDLKSEISSHKSMKKVFQDKEHVVHQMSKIASELVTDEIGLSSSVCKSARVTQKCDRLTTTWTQLVKKIEERIGKLESSLKQCISLKSNLINLNSWLDELEVDLSNVADLTLDNESMTHQMKSINRINSEMEVKSKDFEKVAHVNLNCFNVKVKEAQDEIRRVLNRYQETQKDLDQRRSRVKGLMESFKLLGKSIDETRKELSSLEDRIESYAVFKSSSVDSTLIERVQNLSKMASSIEKKAADLEINGKNLIKNMDSVENQKCSSLIVSQSKDIKVKASSIHEKLVQRTDELMKAKTSMDKVHRKLEETEHQITKNEENIKRLSSLNSKETSVLEKQKTETEILKTEIEKFSSVIEETKKTIVNEKTTLKSFDSIFRKFTSALESIEARHASCLTLLTERLSKIETSLRDAREFDAAYKEFDGWLRSVELSLENMSEPSLLVETIEEQIKETNIFQQAISRRQDTLTELERSGSRQEKDKLFAIRSRWNKLTSKITERLRLLEQNVKQAREFSEKYTSLMEWLTRSETIIESASHSESTNSAQIINDLRSLSREFDHKQSHYESVCRLGKSLKEKSPRKEKETFEQFVDKLRSRWTSLQKLCSEVLSDLEKTSSTLERYRKLFKQLKEWCSETEISFDRLQGDRETVQKLIREHVSFTKQFTSKNDSMNSLREIVDDLMDHLSSKQSKEIATEMSELIKEWDKLNAACREKELRLRKALEQSESLQNEVNQMLSWLNEIITSLEQMKINGKEDETIIRRYLAQVNSYKEKMNSSSVDRDQIIAKAQAILLDCHSDATYTIRQFIEKIKSTWDDAASAISRKESQLRGLLDDLARRTDFLSELIDWLSKREREFERLNSKIIPNDISIVQDLIEEMEMFKETVSSCENDLDKIVLEYRKETVTKVRQSRFEKTSLNRTRATDILLEQISDSRVADLVKRWRSLTSKIEDRLIQLRSKLKTYLEREELRDFDFDAWRRRFLDWLDSRSTKPMDFFRKLDDNRDNKITYDEFIEGLLRYKFPSSRCELQTVAAIFDENNDKFIDSKEWMNKLRVPSEIEMIDNELEKQVAKCTCPSKYQVHKVADRKYRFGESQKLRLVRILRSVIMVRVGGGWVSLDEFLLKNDPCRAKGRTNVELREPLADGVSQGMMSFQSKSPFSYDSSSSVGPITNIRVKTERSMPMSGSFDSHHYHNDNDDDNDDDSLNECEF